MGTDHYYYTAQKHTIGLWEQTAVITQLNTRTVRENASVIM